MVKVFSYIVRRDFGFAPNPFNGFLTLATCKPDIRKSALIGDFLIGNSSKSNGHKLIFMAKISDIVSFDKYWNDDRFKVKKPVLNGSLKKMYGDNIYHHDKNGNWIQENSHHSNKDGSINQYNLKKDTGKTDHVLICSEFIYFGKKMITLEKKFESCIHKGIGFHYAKEQEALDLWNTLRRNYPQNMIIGMPNHFDKFTRYDGLS